MSGGGGIDSALEYMLSSTRGLLWLHPVVIGAQAAASRSLGDGNTYPLVEAPRHV
jgi:hypothetical protein